jgi:transcriptional regulator with XRE-family HTH domain
MTHSLLPSKLRVLRAQQGLTLIGAAKQIGIGRDTLSAIERGHQHPTFPTVKLLAEGYGVPVEDLLDEPSEATVPKEDASQDEAPKKLLTSPRVQGWLADEKASLLLASDEDFVAHITNAGGLEELKAISDALDAERARVLASLDDPSGATRKAIFPSSAVVADRRTREGRLKAAFTPAKQVFYLRSEIRGEYRVREMAVDNYARRIYDDTSQAEAEEALREELASRVAA